MTYSHRDDERDPFENDEDPTEDQDNVTCDNCGEEGLSWVNTGIRWRLVDDHGLHLCKANADDFEDVSEPSFADMI
jgi:hypothetical protein